MRTSSFLAAVWLRADLPRDTACAYWAGPHADVVRQLPTPIEYLQHHFSATDHGFWPSTTGVGTAVPPQWRLDGVAETRFPSTAAALMTPPRMTAVFLDEQNVFERVLGHPTGPAGGRWWTRGHDDTVGYRVALLLRGRRGARPGAFRRFVHQRLGPALSTAGARDLRTYTFLPWSRFFHHTPGVAHDNPVHRRYHGAVLFGGADRASVRRLLDSSALREVVAEQHTVFVAVHAFGVEHSVPVIRPTRG